MWMKVRGTVPFEGRLVTCKYCHGTRLGTDGKECRVCMGVGQQVVLSHAETRKRHDIPEGEKVEGE